MKENDTIFTCCICHRLSKGFGNNPYPICESGLCCDECNEKVVVARLLDMCLDKNYNKNI